MAVGGPWRVWQNSLSARGSQMVVGERETGGEVQSRNRTRRPWSFKWLKQ